MQRSISIIIPTLNEEKYLPKLLKSIRVQTKQPVEVIVADANSVDKTRIIARDFGCKVIDGGLPAKGRNEGLKLVSGNLILFLDADVVLPANFLEKAANEMEERELDVASCFAAPTSCSALDSLSCDLANTFFIMTERLYPHAQGFCIFATKEILNKIGNFDETILVGEDHEFVNRASRAGKFAFLKSQKIFASPRRMLEEGRFKTLLRYFLMGLYRVFFGEIRSDIFKYKFGKHYKA